MPQEASYSAHVLRQTTVTNYGYSFPLLHKTPFPFPSYL